MSGCFGGADPECSGNPQPSPSFYQFHVKFTVLLFFQEFLPPHRLRPRLENFRIRQFPGHLL